MRGQDGRGQGLDMLGKEKWYYLLLLILSIEAFEVVIT